MSLRSQVLNLYKTLLYYGKDYPTGYDYFRQRLKKSFQKNAKLIDSNEIQRLIARGEFVIKEIEALYSLKKYRTLKQRYYDSASETEMQNIKKQLERQHTERK